MQKCHDGVDVAMLVYHVANPYQSDLCRCVDAESLPESILGLTSAHRLRCIDGVALIRLVDLIISHRTRDQNQD